MMKNTIIFVLIASFIGVVHGCYGVKQKLKLEVAHNSDLIRILERVSWED